MNAPEIEAEKRMWSISSPNAKKTNARKNKSGEALTIWSLPGELFYIPLCKG